MPCGREINDPPSPALLHLVRHPRSVVPNFNPQRARSQPRRPPRLPCLGHRHCRRHPLPPPPSCSSTYVHHGPFSRRSLFLFPSLSLISLRSFHQLSATSCFLDQRPGDGTTRKAGFKIIMARAILITVARTTTISGWHHHYHYRYHYQQQHRRRRRE